MKKNGYVLAGKLAIEGNTLREDQVSDLLDGKRVVAPVRQIQEVKNATGGVNGGVNGGVSVIIAYVKEHPGNRANAIAQALDMPLRSIQRYLAQMKTAGDVEFRGAPRNGGYFWKAEESETIG